MGVCCMEYLNQILFDCLWGTRSSSIDAQELHNVRANWLKWQLLWHVFCMCLGPILAGTPTIRTESCCGFALCCQTCRHAATTDFLSHLPLPPPPHFIVHCHPFIRHHMLSYEWIRKSSGMRRWPSGS